MKYPKCPYCGKNAALVSDVEIYGRSYGREIYLCRPCGAYVGCHKGTTVPMGRLANEELRSAKRRAHDAFDSIWKSGEMSRREAYKWLSDALGKRPAECHIGEFDVEDCNRVVRAVEEKRKSHV